MSASILHGGTATAAAAATTQPEQLDAIEAAFAGDITVRAMAGAVVAEVCTYGTWVRDSAEPRGMTLGALSACTVNVTDATITSFVFVEGSTPIFSIPAADASLDSPTTKTGRRTSLSDAVLTKHRIIADATLPLGTALTYLLTFALADTATVDVAIAGSITNTGTGACAWSITPPAHVTVTPSGGTLAAGGTQSLSVEIDTAGTYSLTLVSSGATITGATQTVVASEPFVPSAEPKYRFQTRLLFHRAHQRIQEASYVNSLGQTVFVPSMDHFFGRYDGVHDSNTQTACGSDDRLICAQSLWSWENEGGDWLDNSSPIRIEQGTVAWATSAPIANGTPAGEFTLDVSDLIAYCDQQQTWYGLYVTVSGGDFKLIGPCNTGQAKSQLEIVRGGASETQALWYACSLISSSYINAMDDVLTTNNGGKFVMEFYRPESQAVAASSAILRVRHNGITSGNPVLKVFLVRPNIPDMALQVPGIANSYTLDAGLHAHPSVAATMRITDSTAITDVLDVGFVHAGTLNWDGTGKVNLKREALFDPYLWGEPGGDDLPGVATLTQPQRDALMPTRAIANGINKLQGIASKSTLYGDTIRVVTGAELESRGIPTLAPGLGALELVYPGMNVLNGQAHPQSWTTGGILSDNRNGPDLEMHFKSEHIGRVVDGYMRMYVCLAEGWEPDDSVMQWCPLDGSEARWGKWPEEYGADPQTLQWRATDFSGKFPGGIQQLTPGNIVERYTYPTRLDGSGATDTTKVLDYPGNGYSSSSSVYGYQGRWQFKQGFYKAGFEGPACGGAAIALETYDFAQNAFCIPSQTFIGGWTVDNYAGFSYGLGYLRQNKWYCVEMRWKLNTITYPYAEPAVGTHYLESGYVQDGLLEWWVDGVFASRSPVFATRTSRIIDWALQNANGRPFGNGTGDLMRPMTGVEPEAYMGATAAILQCYYGGRSALPKDMKVLVNGIVVSNGEYIGPMKGVSAENGGMAIPEWVPAAGGVATISYSSGMHPSGLPATRYDIRTQIQSWNPTPSDMGPWAAGPPGSRIYNWTSITSFCGFAFAPSTREYIGFGGGHATVCVPVPYAFDLVTRSWKWLDTPPPTDGLYQCAGYPGGATVANMTAAYAADQLDPNWAEWQGDYSGWGAYARPGRIFPEPGHSDCSVVWVPGAFIGNTNGAFIPLMMGSGSHVGSDITLAHYFDLDATERKWKRLANHRYNPSTGAGGSVYFGGSVNKVFSLTNGSTQVRTTLDVLDGTTKLWTTRTSTNGAPISINTCGMGAHLPSGLLINFHQINSLGQPYYVGVTQGAWAVDAATAAAGSHTWTQLTLSATSWPVGSAGSTDYVGWCYCPRNGCFYAVGGADNSTTLWKLSPPAGAVTQADHLTGTWQITTETLSSPIRSRNGAGGSSTAANVNFVYNRLVWDELSGCLLWTEEYNLGVMQAIRPTGV